MKLKLALLSLVLGLTLSAHAQSATAQGQFNWSVLGFAPITLPANCQPLPPTFPSCALPNPVLGVSYTVVLPTVVFKGPVTCTVSSGALPTGATLKTNATTNTSCEINWPSPTVTGTAAFTISVSGS